MDLIVKKSHIEGNGVFANKNFKKGDVVLKWSDSPILTAKQLEKISEEDEKYLYYNGNKRILVTPPARFVNHSCNPNTFIRNFCGIAKRNIKKGEEITEDYSKENNPNINIICKCGSKNCKRNIKGHS